MPVLAQASSRPIVKVGGSALSDPAFAGLIGAVVIDRLTSPDMFELVFADPDRKALKDAGLEIGSEVEVEAETGTEGELLSLIKGEVTAIEFEYDSRGGRAVVRGYDMSHRLSAGRKTATFQGMSYSDIAQKVASDAGFTAEVDATDGVIDHVLQANQSDLDFLYGLARRANRDFRIDGSKLLFKEPVPSDGAPDEGDAENAQPDQLVCGENLQTFRARVSAVGQVSKVEVRGWDPKEKKEVTAEAAPTAAHADVKLKPDALAEKVGGKTLVVVNHGVEDAESAERLAKARAEQIGSAAFEATAVARGDAKLKAGVAVSVTGVGDDLSGKWVVAGTRHEFVDGQYRTHLDFTGRQDRTLYGVLNQGGGGGGASDRVPGVVIAIVDSLEDPKELGRVRLKFPWMAENAVSDWARVAAPGASLNAGTVWLPQVGDEVLVAFEHGDTRLPIVVGGLWNGSDTIPFTYDDKHVDQGKVVYSGWTSRAGHKISIWESKDNSAIELITAKEAVKVILDDKNKEVRIETTGKLVIDAQQDVEIKAGGSMKLEASGQMTIKGSTVALN
jgi:phage protein D/phage baseplate assembly protein gpV